MKFLLLFSVLALSAGATEKLDQGYGTDTKSFEDEKNFRPEVKDALKRNKENKKEMAKISNTLRKLKIKQKVFTELGSNVDKGRKRADAHLKKKFLEKLKENGETKKRLSLGTKLERDEYSQTINKTFAANQKDNTKICVSGVIGENSASAQKVPGTDCERVVQGIDDFAEKMHKIITEGTLIDYNLEKDASNVDINQLSAPSSPTYRVHSNGKKCFEVTFYDDNHHVLFEGPTGTQLAIRNDKELARTALFLLSTNTPILENCPDIKFDFPLVIEQLVKDAAATKIQRAFKKHKSEKDLKKAENEFFEHEGPMVSEALKHLQGVNLIDSRMKDPKAMLDLIQGALRDADSWENDAAPEVKVQIAFKLLVSVFLNGIDKNQEDLQKLQNYAQAILGTVLEAEGGNDLIQNELGTFIMVTYKDFFAKNQQINQSLSKGIENLLGQAHPSEGGQSDLRRPPSFLNKNDFPEPVVDRKLNFSEEHSFQERLKNMEDRLNKALDDKKNEVDPCVLEASQYLLGLKDPLNEVEKNTVKSKIGILDAKACAQVLLKLTYKSPLRQDHDSMSALVEKADLAKLSPDEKMEVVVILLLADLTETAIGLLGTISTDNKIVLEKLQKYKKDYEQTVFDKNPELGPKFDDLIKHFSKPLSGEGNQAREGSSTRGTWGREQGNTKGKMIQDAKNRLHEKNKVEEIEQKPKKTVTFNIDGSVDQGGGVTSRMKNMEVMGRTPLRNTTQKSN